MKKESTLAYLRPLLPKPRVLGCAWVFLLGGLLLPALAQKKGVVDPSQSVDWAAGFIEHVQKMHNLFTHHDVEGSQPTPPDIPKFEKDSDPSGQVETFQPGGATVTAENPFFQNLGTNGRTCFTCHQPQTGWTISAASASERFQASGGTDPLFRLIDGATCPSDDVSTPEARRQAYILLIEKGLIRIGLPLPPAANPPNPPPTLQFEVTHVDDPYNCTTNTVTGLQSPTMGTLSMYRRPLPSTNLGFDTAIMWDGREPSFQHQALDATLGHAEGNLPGPSEDQQNEIVAFETGIYTAQIFDNKAHVLNAAHATGGPVTLSQQTFSVGENDPFGTNFNPNVFDLYTPWLDLPDANGEAKDRQSVARGEKVFNTKGFKITGLAPTIPENTAGFCGTCHDSTDVGNHSVKLPLNIGIADVDPPPPGLDISGLPVFTIQCDDGRQFQVTDPGRALITGSCDDMGKFKGPILRGLAARAPYFHNGSAATLMDVVNFYNQRFSIGFTDQEKKDLINFLNTL
jgi:hypothetical protein